MLLSSSATASCGVCSAAVESETDLSTERRPQTPIDLQTCQGEGQSTPCIAARSAKQLSAAAMPWYPPVLSNRAESACSQPMREDEFPCEPRGSTSVRHGMGNSPDATPPSVEQQDGDCRQGQRPPSKASKSHSLLRHRVSGTPSSYADEDDEVVIVRFRDDEAVDEEAMIRRLAEGAFWGMDAPAAEGLHHIRDVWDLPPGAQDGLQGEDGEFVDDEFAEWEDDSAAYADSLDSEQLEWLEEQLQAKDNPDDFFF